MKILHISTYSNSGGAAIAARRHCEAMRAAGIDARMLCLYGQPDEFTTIDPRSGIALKKKQRFAKIRHYWDRLFIKRVAWHWLDADYDVSKLKDVKEADIIYIHWVNEFLSVNAIYNLLELGKTVVWYMHDMWPITGGCHHSFDCKGYEGYCSHCPQMKICRNMASHVLEEKVKGLSHFANFYAAAPSNWLCDCISTSSLFKNHKLFHVPNVIDTERFVPADKEEVRKRLGLPIDKKLVIFSATGTGNPFKGVGYFIEMANRLSESTEDIEFVVLGKSNPQIFSEKARKKIHFAGFIDNQNKMIAYYNSADILVTTSLADNFPNVIIEAMACGVPAVGFATGGIVDQIQHKQNGWIVPQKDVDGLVKGIHWILYESDYASLQANARKYVEENCSYHNVLKIHKPIVDLILNKQ